MPDSARIEALISQMTLEEKLEQLQMPHPTNERLGIPALVWGEGLHGAIGNFTGLTIEGATVFPQAIALGCSWDPELIEEIGAAIARECRAGGIHQVYSPNLDVARDARFGRVEETFGEDVHLVTRLGVAAVQGLQGRGESRFDHEHVLATGKHFAGYGVPERGINGSPSTLTERELRSVWLPSFEAAVREAGLASMMPSHQDNDGVPCHANRWLLTQVLREEWGFDGFVVSDNRDVARLRNQHAIAETYGAAARLALLAGVDQELIIQVRTEVRCYADPLREEISAGRVPLNSIDEAVRRVLRAKERIGLLSSATPQGPPRSIVGCAAHRALAQRAAERSIVLLRNEGNLLPLARARLRRVAVIGPLADDARPKALGGYTNPSPAPTCTLLAGLREIAGSAIEVRYAPGCELLDVSQDKIPEAVRIAEECDIAIVAVGETEELCREGVDRDDIGLYGAQLALVQAVAATGKPVVVVLLHGRPLGIPWIAENIPAIVDGWYAGTEGGRALARIIFGEINPSGKLCITYPRNAGQVPLYYSHRPAFTGSGGGKYFRSDKAPLFSFGHGLSYTTFKYSTPVVGQSEISPDGETFVSVDVTNAGGRAGEEIVQFYVRDMIASLGRPRMLLQGFRRVSLQPGQSQTVRFDVGPAQLSFWGPEMKRVVEPGEFQLLLGPSSEQLEAVTLRVVLP